MNDYNAYAMQAPAGLATPPGQPNKIALPPGQPNKLTSPFYPGGGDFGMKPVQPGLIGRAMNPQPAPGGGFMPDERGFNLYAPPAKPNMYQAGNPNQVGSAAWAQAQAMARNADVNSPQNRQARWDNYARTMPQPQPAPQPMPQNTGFDPYAMARQQLANRQDLDVQQRNNLLQQNTGLANYENAWGKIDSMITMSQQQKQDLLGQLNSRYQDNVQRNNLLQAQMTGSPAYSQGFGNIQASQPQPAPQRRGFGGDFTQPYYGPKAGF